jgi:hypothetical protein
LPGIEKNTCHCRQLWGEEWETEMLVLTLMDYVGMGEFKLLLPKLKCFNHDAVCSTTAELYRVLLKNKQICLKVEDILS